MNIMYEGFKNGLNIDKIEMFMAHGLNDKQMQLIFDGFRKLNLSIEQVSVYAEPKYSPAIMEKCFEGFKHNVDILYIENYRDTCYVFEELIKKNKKTK